MISKEFSQTLTLLNALSKGISGNFKNEKASVKITKNVGKGFKFFVQQSGFHTVQDFSPLENQKIKTRKFGELLAQFFIPTNRTTERFSGIAAEFCNKPNFLSQKRFFRQVVEVPQKVNFTHVIDDSAYRLAENSFQRGWIRVEFKTTQIDLFTFQEKESQKAFLILDATEPIHLEEFSKKAYMILIAVGFLTGKFYQNDGYFFGFDDEKMETPVCWKYMELRKSMDAKYYPVHSNAYGIARDHDVAAQFHLKLKPVSNPVFSSLCSKLDEEPEFQALMVLQLEACSSSLLLMPTGLFVVLEGFRNLLKLKNGKHFEFLEREISAEIKDKLIEILGAFEKRVPEESHRILKNKITNLDQLPNQTVLMKPFEIFNIPISKADEECIGRRNTFLHGKISLGLYEKGEDKKAGEEMLYHAMKTYTLVSALILKYIGFEGFIINHAKWHEKNAGREIDEPLFIEI